MPVETVIETRVVEVETFKYAQKPKDVRKALQVVLDQLSWAKAMEYRNRVYVVTKQNAEIDVLCPSVNADLKCVVDDLSKNCQVCYLGGLLFSKARVADHVPLRDIVSSSAPFREGKVLTLDASHRSVRDALSEIFDPFTLDLCEAAFERDSSFEDIADHISDLEDEDEKEKLHESMMTEVEAAADYLDRLEKAVAFDEEMTTNDEALCVAYNLRDNQGTFVPAYTPPDAIRLLKRRMAESY